jgi:methionyl-tRNA synthetase
VNEFFCNVDFSRGIDAVFAVIQQTNKHFTDNAPWKLVPNLKTNFQPTQEQSQRLSTILYIALESVRICSLLLQPVMPDTMSGVLDRIGVQESSRTFENTKFGRLAGEQLGSDIAFLPFKIPNSIARPNKK